LASVGLVSFLASVGLVSFLASVGLVSFLAVGSTVCLALVTRLGAIAAGAAITTGAAAALPSSKLTDLTLGDPAPGFFSEGLGRGELAPLYAFG